MGRPRKRRGAWALGPALATALVAGLASPVFAQAILAQAAPAAAPPAASSSPATGAAQPQPASPESKTDYTPQSGQSGKDVVWVPTPQALVDMMLDMAKATPQDYLIDLGSGDGRTVITAAKRGLKAHGIEYNPDMVELSRRRAAAEGVSERATFERADIFTSDFSKAQIITLFLLPTLNERLRPQLLDLPPGTRVVSNSFDMGEWKADQTSKVADCNSWCTAFLWIVPAKVDGSWRLGEQRLQLKQRFQEVSGTLGDTPITDGKLSGDTLTFKAGGTMYVGKVNGSTITGESGGRTPNWTASRS